MPVARDDLCRGGLRHKTEHATGHALHLGLAAAVHPNRARKLPDTHRCERPLETVGSALELEGPSDELRAEGDRLCMDAVGAPDHRGVAVLLRTSHDCGEAGLEPLENQLAGLT